MPRKPTEEIERRTVRALMAVPEIAAIGEDELMKKVEEAAKRGRPPGSRKDPEGDDFILYLLAFYELATRRLGEDEDRKLLNKTWSYLPRHAKTPLINRLMRQYGPNRDKYITAVQSGLVLRGDCRADGEGTDALILTQASAADIPRLPDRCTDDPDELSRWDDIRPEVWLFINEWRNIVLGSGLRSPAPTTKA